MFKRIQNRDTFEITGYYLNGKKVSKDEYDLAEMRAIVRGKQLQFRFDRN